MRRLQEKGELNHDALIFINFDNDYLQNHQPVDTFYFSQDTADGSFNGYNSWAEKARVSPQWTKIERSRRIQSVARKAMTLLGNPPELADIPELIAVAELIRLRTLSTTHFGMATPFVTPQREQAANELIARLDNYTDIIEKRINSKLRDYLRHHPPSRPGNGRFQWLDTFVLLHPDEAQSSGRFLKLKFTGGSPPQGPYLLAAPNGKRLRGVSNGPVSGQQQGGGQWLQLYVQGEEPLVDGVYHLYRDRLAAGTNPGPDNPVRFDGRVLSNGIIEVRFDPDGRLEGIYLNGVRQAEPGSLVPYVRYDGRKFQIPKLRLFQIDSIGKESASVRLSGTFPDLSPAGGPVAGKAEYMLSLPAGCPYLLLRAEITFQPLTAVM